MGASIRDRWWRSPRSIRVRVGSRYWKSASSKTKARIRSPFRNLRVEVRSRPRVGDLVLMIRSLMTSGASTPHPGTCSSATWERRCPPREEVPRGKCQKSKPPAPSRPYAEMGDGDAGSHAVVGRSSPTQENVACHRGSFWVSRFDLCSGARRSLPFHDPDLQIGHVCSDDDHGTVLTDRLHW